MYCINCGEEVAEAAAFCSACGGKVQLRSSPARSDDREQSESSGLDGPSKIRNSPEPDPVLDPTDEQPQVTDAPAAMFTPQERVAILEGLREEGQPMQPMDAAKLVIRLFVGFGISIAGLITAFTADVYGVRMAALFFFAFGGALGSKWRKGALHFFSSLAFFIAGGITVWSKAFLDISLWDDFLWFMFGLFLWLVGAAASGANFDPNSDFAAPIGKKNKRRRQAIPEQVRHSVWRRDEGHCVKCGSQEKLEYDHIIPWSKGGSDTERNIQLLCERCNRTKSASI